MDAGAPDGPPDAALGDLLDASEVDHCKVDSSMADVFSNADVFSDADLLDAQASDLGAGGPCSSKAFVIQSFGPKMKTCFSWTKFVNQCEAMALCGVGWHSCTASEFRQNGGKTTPALPQAWIAGCVRFSGPPVQPQNTPCPCVMASAPSAPVVESCDNTTSAGISNYNIGIVTDMSCYRLGTGAQNDAYWNAWASVAPLPAAACCLNGS
jgi:hypothetical protein